MNTITANASLEAASQTIETVLRTDVVTGGDRWNNAVHRISEVMVSIANILLQYYSTHIFQTHICSVIPHATAIPQLLIAVNAVWPQDSTQWPNWLRICNPELHVLARHDWWPWVTFNFAAEQHASESTPKVFGQQAQQECAEIESSTSGSVVEDEEVIAKQKANAAGKRKATESGTEEVLELEQDASRLSRIAEVKQKETGEGDHQQHREVVECGRTRTRRCIEHAKPLTINMVPPCDHPMRAPTPPYVSPITPKEEPDVEFAFNVGCTECVKKNIDCY